jgi:uncharacterized membrane protein HdeD (DUF308 family)
MKKLQNENSTDRTIRVIIGIILLIVGYLALTGTSQIVAYVIGAILVLTGLTGFCALYKLFGINTYKK